jgi:hypothetical protein
LLSEGQNQHKVLVLTIIISKYEDNPFIHNKVIANYRKHQAKSTFLNLKVKVIQKVQVYPGQLGGLAQKVFEFKYEGNLLTNNLSIRTKPFIILGKLLDCGSELRP